MTSENREMIEFRIVVLNKRISRLRVLGQYSAMSLPFFGMFYILSGEFNASLKEKLNLIHKQRYDFKPGNINQPFIRDF